MNKIKSLLITGILITAAGCTEPVEMNTTQMAAATGGVIGAGLGAIIGSQTGDPGAGIAIGAAAGVASGALIGDSIMRQEEALKNQDEAIERQERVIAAQRSELEELRKMNQDTPGFKSRLNNSLSKQNTNTYPGRTVSLSQESRASFGNTSAGAVKGQTINPSAIRPTQQSGNTAIRERNIQPQIPAVAPVAAKQPNTYSSAIYDSNKKADVAVNQVTKPKLPVSEPAVELAAVKESANFKSEPVESETAESDTDTDTEVDQPAVAAISAEVSSGNTSECEQAAAEISKSKLATDTSDKLFHTRRAIRLCPQMPVYHQSLGEVYLSLSRKEDALFEFQEALKYDPTYAPAKESAAKLSSAGSKFSNNKY